ncbi:hypothetical protein [Bosea sp. WAO]|uniref:hypothetical protein n=1 Tax=Bosea sp. WAO TaxID=406341 RepID=UPI000B1988C0|nr:hypothetical protein [Bosea sp. WAO]
MTGGLIRGVAALLLLCSIGGCANEFAAREAITADQIQRVVDDLKRQVSIYVAYQNSREGRQRLVEQSSTNPCGNGLIDFDIKSVKITLLMTTEKSGSLGLDVAPIPVGGATLGGGFSFSSSRADTQELTFSASPLKNSNFRYVGQENVETAPIAGALINLRDSLIKSSKVENRICFQTSNADNTFKLGVTLSSKFGADGTLGVAPLAVTASGETKGSTGNTLVVTFVPSKPRTIWLTGGGKGGYSGNDNQVWGGNNPLPAKVELPTPEATPGTVRGTGQNCPPGSNRPDCRGTFGSPGPKM